MGIKGGNWGGGVGKIGRKIQKTGEKRGKLPCLNPLGFPAGKETLGSAWKCSHDSRPWFCFHGNLGLDFAAFAPEFPDSPEEYPGFSWTFRKIQVFSPGFPHCPSSGWNSWRGNTELNKENFLKDKEILGKKTLGSSRVGLNSWESKGMLPAPRICHWLQGKSQDLDGKAGNAGDEQKLSHPGTFLPSHKIVSQKNIPALPKIVS